jgi:hypothetical protein
MIRAAAVVMMVCAALPSAHAADTAPVLIELFTAEGCSSCPPADAFLLKLDAAQPVAGAQLIVLSEHVDYWDHQGWPDPFSSKLFTERQADYVRALGLHEAYTPQFVVDGTNELRLSNRQQIAPLLEKAAAARKIPVTISALKVQAGNPATVSGRIEADGSLAQHKAEVYLALALDHVQSKVLRGENRGETLTHVGVLEDLAKIGELSPGQKLAQDFHANLKAAFDPNDVRVVVFLQEPGHGKVVGAALQKTVIERASAQSRR